MNKVIRVACVDLDDTVYQQTLFDNQIIDMAFSALCQETSGLANVHTRLLSSLKECRSRDRYTKNLFQDVFLGYDLCESLSARFVSLYRHYVAIGRPVIYPSLDAVSFIKSAKMHSMTVLISNGPITQQMRKIDLLGIANLFDRILILDGNHERICKPDTSCFRNLMHGLSIVPSSSSFMVGDSASDFEFSQRLGFRYYHPEADLGWKINVK